MNKQPQNIIKISSQEEGGAYLQMVFDAGNLDHWEITKRFHNFLRGVGYNLRYPNIVVEEEMLPKFEGPVDDFYKQFNPTKPGEPVPDETWNPAG